MSATMSSENAAEYTLGRTHPNTKDHATYETKPSPPGYTGGGYTHWRSTEHRPHTPTPGKEDVYASVHRLTAVVACYDLDTPLEDILDDLHGKDVHHSAPEVDRDYGVPWDNRHDAIEVKDHGRHSSITQAEMRAYGEDAKQQALEPTRHDSEGECSGCGREVDTPATSPGFQGERCIECAKRECGGEPIELRGGR